MWVAFWMAIGAAVFIVIWCVMSKTPLLLLLALTGALFGWVIGIFATPYSTTEKEQFSEFAKIVSGIVTGFLLSKLGPLIDAFLLPGANGRPRITDLQIAEQILVTLASFLLTFLFVFGGRLYWREDAAATDDATKTT